VRPSADTAHQVIPSLLIVFGLSMNWSNPGIFTIPACSPFVTIFTVYRTGPGFPFTSLKRAMVSGFLSTWILPVISTVQGKVCDFWKSLLQPREWQGETCRSPVVDIFVSSRILLLNGGFNRSIRSRIAHLFFISTLGKLIRINPE